MLALEVHGEVLVDIVQVLLYLATHLFEVVAQVLVILELCLFGFLFFQLSLPFHINLALLHMWNQVLCSA